MKFGVILAGGIGSRMGNVEKPKQFLEIGSKPIIVHTVEKFVLFDELEKVIVLCPENWIEYTKGMIRKYIGDLDKIAIIAGGAVRNETIMNAIAYIDETYGVDDETIIVTHDAVRPFVTHRIISDNIRAAMQYGACDTVFPATDTIVRADDNEIISDIPDRSKLYQGQTPQSFRAAELRETYLALSEEEKTVLTDAAKIYVMKGKEVHLVRGEAFNIKVTYPHDLTVAEVLMKGER